MRKRVLSTTAVAIFLALLVVYGGISARDEMAVNIINRLLTDSFEYTVSYCPVNFGGAERQFDANEGKMISKPYQHYMKIGSPEEVGALVVYSYEENGELYSYTKVNLFDGEKFSTRWNGGKVSEKGNGMFAEEGRIYTYDREEVVNGLKTSVYTAEYKERAIAANEKDYIELPAMVQQEYFVDLKGQTVVRIFLDTKEVTTASAVANQMILGMTEEEAEKAVQKDENIEVVNILVDIRNLGGEVTIIPPDIEMTNQEEQ